MGRNGYSEAYISLAPWEGQHERVNLLLYRGAIPAYGNAALVRRGNAMATERETGRDVSKPGEEQFRLLFAANPHPMWVYDLETLRFLEVNDAAIDLYGYTRDEFLDMRITDIRPQEDLDRLAHNLNQARPALESSGRWRHTLKGGR